MSITFQEYSYQEHIHSTKEVGIATPNTIFPRQPQVSTNYYRKNILRCKCTPLYIQQQQAVWLNTSLVLLLLSITAAAVILYDVTHVCVKHPSRESSSRGNSNDPPSGNAAAVVLTP